MKDFSSKKGVLILILNIFISFNLYSQSSIVRDFKVVCDSLETLMFEETGLKTELRTSNITRRGSTIDFYFSQTLTDYPWKDASYNYFIENLQSLFPSKYKRYHLGEIYVNRTSLKSNITEAIHNDGSVHDFKYSRKDPNPERAKIVEKGRAYTINRGLDGRHIALWHGHGSYYHTNNQQWQWQRPPLFQTTEDLFTPSFVIPYIAPMLENAGAYVILPTERDYNTFELIIDNDPYYKSEEGDRNHRLSNAEGRNHQLSNAEGRNHGIYKETGKWTKAGVGFSDPKPYYTDEENPFKMGTARQAEATDNSKKEATAKWEINVENRGTYSVYISYTSLKNSTEAAKYKVKHLGGISEFSVNQKMGGGMWIYLGDFEFSPNNDAYVSLSNVSSQHKNSVVTADAVKVGGGMGNIIRKTSNDEYSEFISSGLPRFLEASRYFLQWSGADTDVYYQTEGENDYQDNYLSKGEWVNSLTGGTDINPNKEGKKIPIDLSLAIHSDAGITPNDSTVGTLAIYTWNNKGRFKLPNSESRMSHRRYSDLIQTQITDDLRHQYDSIWNRRGLWDRSYFESRTPSTPSVIIEMLSHQNFGDMKYGLDPNFKFTISRSIYKGVLKYLSERYQVEYTVQPLPINSFASNYIITSDGSIKGNSSSSVNVELSWEENIDPLESTARPKGYILFTRLDDGGFDQGRIIKTRKNKDGRISTSVLINKGHIYSYQIRAYNEGGLSFPSETLALGVPKGINTDKINENLVLVVNNFDRLSSPAYFDTESYAGFDNDTDSGVPYLYDYSFCGKMYENNRNREWTSDSSPGFGASHTDKVGQKIAGNSFDYPYIHGKAILKAGYPFYSMSRSAFTSEDNLSSDLWAVDLVCGKQVSMQIGNINDELSFQVYTKELQNRIVSLTKEGVNLLISGSYIATDIWDSIYQIEVDPTYIKDSKDFAKKVLGYTWAGKHASNTGEITNIRNKANLLKGLKNISFYNYQNPLKYSVESPDGIKPVKGSTTIMRYSDTRTSAGISYIGAGYKTICLGFPIESIKEDSHIESIIKSSLRFFEND